MIPAEKAQEVQQMINWVTGGWDAVAYLIIAFAAGYFALGGYVEKSERMWVISLLLCSFLFGRAVLLLGAW